MDEPIIAEQVLPYSIYTYSGYSSTYVPEHILHDTPYDSASRWTGASSQSLGTSALGDATPDGTGLNSGSLGVAGTVNAGSSNSTNGITPRYPANTKPKPRLDTDIVPIKQTQFVTVELVRPALVTHVGFGKYKKPHPCNLAEFKIYGGMLPNKRYMELLYTGGLRNDSEKEKFLVASMDGRALRDNWKSIEGKNILPIKYIRIEALAAHNLEYNISIWHLWLEGIQDEQLVERVIQQYEARRTLQTNHLLLAHLRRQCLFPAYSSLLNSLPGHIIETFEHPLVSALHTAIVTGGLFDTPSGPNDSAKDNKIWTVESILEEIKEQGFMDAWGRSRGKVVGSWQMLHPGPPRPRKKKAALLESIPRKNDDNESFPSPRAGHQIAKSGNRLYIHGGWDGERELDDFWVWTFEDESQTTGNWKRLNPAPNVSWPRRDRFNTSAHKPESTPQARPSARSCHQMVVDERTGYIYILGGIISATPKAEVVKEVKDEVTSVPQASTYVSEEVKENSPFSTPFQPFGPTGPPPDQPNSNVSDFPPFIMDDNTTGVSENETDLRPPETSEPRRRKLTYAIKPPEDCCDLWRYIPDGDGEGPESDGRWELLCDDVGICRGPLALYDHQMVIDSTRGIIFVYGGRRANKEEIIYSGLYSYEIASGRWTHLYADPPEMMTESGNLISRNGHSLVLDSNMLYVFGGQRRQQHLNDLWAIEWEQDLPANDRQLHLESNERPSFSKGTLPPPPRIKSMSLLTADLSANGGPSPGFTHRTVFDPTTRDCIVAEGLVKRPSGLERPSRRIWWSKGGVNPDNWKSVHVRGIEPEPRFATPVTFDPSRGELFVMGGNPFDESDDSRRLADLWKLTVTRPSPEEALRTAKFLVRRHRFRELCWTTSHTTALDYLKTVVAEVVNHSDPTEAATFQACVSILLEAPTSKTESPPRLDADGMSLEQLINYQKANNQLATSENEAFFKPRQALFEDLLDFINEHLRPLRENLVDMSMLHWGQQSKGRFD